MAKEQAIALNNLGVEFFVHHRLDEASTMFDGATQVLAETMNPDCPPEEHHTRKRNDAIKLLRVYQESNQDLPPGPPSELSSGILAASSSPPDHGSIDAKAHLLHRMRSQQDPNILSSMFWKTFKVTAHENVHAMPTINEVYIVSGIVMFNRGVCSHLAGSNETANAEEIDIAMQFGAMMYNLCYETISPLVGTSSSGCIRESDDGTIVAQLVMASLNNLALLLHEVEEYDKSRYFSHLLRQFTIQCSEITEEEGFTLQRATFLLNAMLLKRPSTAPSA